MRLVARLHLRALCCLALLALYGCAGHSHRLVAVDALVVGDGAFHHGTSEGPSMVLELNGVRYEAKDFKIEKVEHLDELRARYGAGKHYEQIKIGLDRQHISYSATPVLKSPDGQQLRCVIRWTNTAAISGICTTVSGQNVAIRSA